MADCYSVLTLFLLQQFRICVSMLGNLKFKVSYDNYILCNHWQDKHGKLWQLFLMYHDRYYIAPFWYTICVQWHTSHEGDSYRSENSVWVVFNLFHWPFSAALSKVLARWTVSNWASHCNGTTAVAIIHFVIPFIITGRIELIVNTVVVNCAWCMDDITFIMLPAVCKCP